MQLNVMAKSSESKLAVGIDLGTTYSCVAIFQNGRAKVLPNEHGSRITPSCVSYTDTERLVGDDAIQRLTLDPTNTVYDCKRLIGRTYLDSTIEQDIQHWPFKIIDEKGKPKVQVFYQNETKNLYPELISSVVLMKMKEIAEAYLKQNVSKAVITVPAHFNNSQRQSTLNCAQIAGLEVLRLVNEPTAAAFAYGLERKLADKVLNVLVFDLGGGTFDVSVLQIDSGVIRVLATGGDTHLGGADFDHRLVEEILNWFNEKHNLNNPVSQESSKPEISRLRKACQSAKCNLSNQNKSTITIEKFSGDIDLVYDLSRDKFEELNQDLFSKALSHVTFVLDDAALRPEDVDDVVLVGGSTNIPRIRELLKTIFNGKPLNMSMNPDETVACGAAIQAAILSGHKSSGIDDTVLLDVTPLTLGLNSVGGVMTPIIKRNSLVPCRHVRQATTSYENQNSIDLVVYQGERPMSQDNHFLGVITVDNIPQGPAGGHIVDVTFELDENGCLTMSANASWIKRENHVLKLDHNKAHVGAEEVKRLLKETKVHERKDREMKNRVQARNELVQYHQHVKTLMDSDDLVISPVKKWAIVSKVKDTELWLERKHVNQATENDYRKQLEIFKDSCKAIPPEFINVGIVSEVHVEEISDKEDEWDMIEVD